MQKQQKIHSLVISIGTIIEWAEFTFYGYLAVKLAHLFFNTHDQYKILWSFCIFAISYIVRPFASIIWGLLGDIIGRKYVLSYSMILMGIATLGIGLLPTYEQIGYVSTVILILLRALQGFGIASELTTASIFLIEHANKKPNLSASWISSSSAGGMMIGSILAFLVYLPGMPNWAWRIPFFIGFLSCALGYYLRNNNNEIIFIPSTIDRKTLHAWYVQNTPFVYFFELIQIFFLAAWVGIFIYTCNIWWLSYVTQLHLVSNAHFLIIIANIFVVIFTPIFAILADHIGSHKQLIYGLIFSTFGIPCFFWCTNFHHGMLAIILYTLMDVLVTSALFVYICELLPVKLRCTIIGFVWNIAILLFGSISPIIAQYLVFDKKNLIILIVWLCMFTLLPCIILLFKKIKTH